MTVRDLGYRPYEGVRLPPSRNVWVMGRQAMTRALASWLVRVGLLATLVPLIVGLAMVGWRLAAERLGAEALGPEQIVDHSNRVVRTVFTASLWTSVWMVVLGSGAAAIAEDLTFRAFPFYFAKPVTPTQYLVGRVAATAVLVFLVTFVPAASVVVLIVAVTETLRVELALLLLPAAVFALAIAAVTSTLSVFLSGLGKSRALTMSAWVVLFFVPHAIASLVLELGESPWLLLGSFTGLLTIVGDTLFAAEPEHGLHWYYAVPVLVLASGLAVAGALTKLRRAEVFT